MSKLKKAILDLVGDRILKPAKIHSAEIVSEHFRIIHLESPLFEKENFRPGEKIQINTGDWNVRTYTPIALDSRTGKISILAFLHGQGPGSRWARSVKAGDHCQVLGPRSSLTVNDGATLVFFGDETSIAVASSFRKHFGEVPKTQFVFEVSFLNEAKAVAERLGILENSIFLVKQIDDSHLEKAQELLSAAIENVSDHQLILTGNAKSIQFLRNQLRDLKYFPKQAKMKAYWASGKTGLD